MAWMDVAKVVLIGIGATAVMDVWSLALRHLGVPTLDYALVGRWVGHMRQGRFAHAGIGKAAPVAGERPLGWAVHYATGIAFAALLVAVQGWGWLHAPTWGSAVAVGLATVLVPMCVMQPALGAGFAASKTPTPWRNRLRSLMTHAVFGTGLYLSGELVAMWGA